MAGRKKKYTSNKALATAIERYFRSISRTVPALEYYETGEYTVKGYPVLQSRPMLNDDGEPIMTTEYAAPPSISALCLFLDISRQTWSQYCDEKLNHQFLDTTTRARARVECYLEEQLTVRQKGVQGIIFNLQHNYGWKERRELELSEATREALKGPAQLTMKQKAALVREIAAECALLPTDTHES